MATAKKAAAKRPSSRVKFGDPPPERVKRYDWEKIAQQLRSKPNEWALIFANDKHSLATSIRINGIAALRATRGFRVRTTNNHIADDGRRHCDLWMIYDPAFDTEKD